MRRMGVYAEWYRAADQVADLAKVSPNKRGEFLETLTSWCDGWDEAAHVGHHFLPLFLFQCHDFSPQDVQYSVGKRVRQQVRGKAFRPPPPTAAKNRAPRATAERPWTGSQIPDRCRATQRSAEGEK